MDTPVTRKLEELGIKDAYDVAALFGMTYEQLSTLVYAGDDKSRYRVFEIKKKSGATRQISAPRLRLSQIQKKLASILAESYVPKPGAHGFIKDRSIVTNAERHLDKRFVFNVDIAGFFDAIHFGRVRNLFMAAPFSIPRAPAIVLAQICCFQKRLPQGAPTSPVVTNLICRKLDRELQALAKHCRATYTRYVDDISFSFSCSRSRLPPAIVQVTEQGAVPGQGLSDIISSNGFALNPAKTRLHERHQRLEVTGLVVNEFVNVRREFVRRIGSMLYAWETHGLQAAADELNSKYSGKLSHRASGSPRRFQQVVKGRLAYLHMVRGQRDPVYTKLARRFNKLSVGLCPPLPVIEPTLAEGAVGNAVFIIEILYNGKDGELHSSQGTGFILKGVGFVTAAHVVTTYSGALYEEILVHPHDDPGKEYRLEIKSFDLERDLAVGVLVASDGSPIEISGLPASKVAPKQKDCVVLVGYPAYKTGQTPYWVDSTVATLYGQKNVAKFEIANQIREGNSGGPVLNEAFEVIGIAVEGAEKGGGNNGVVQLEELFKMLKAEGPAVETVLANKAEVAGVAHSAMALNAG